MSPYQGREELNATTSMSKLTMHMAETMLIIDEY